MKQDREIDTALREVAKQRDKLLREMPRLCPGREADLRNFLAGEFPVEAALCKRATNRDQLLNPPLAIPSSVELTLRRQLATAASDRAADGLRWWRFFRSPQSVVASACVLVAAAVLSFGKWRNAPLPVTEQLPRTAQTGEEVDNGIALLNRSFERAELLTRTISVPPFNLRASGPASLQAFLAINKTNFGGGRPLPIDVRLDRPMRVSLMEDEAETP